MPSDHRAAPASASPSDTALVERVRRGDRRAFAILFARHAPAVHARAVEAGLGPAAAARVLRDVFRTAEASLGDAAPAADTGGWLRGLTMDRLAAPRGPVPRLHGDTTAAVRRSGSTLTPVLRDAVWRELERGLHARDLPAWRRRPAALAGTGLIGVLVAAVAVVGLLVREQIQPVAPAGAIPLTAEPMEEPTAEEELPPPAPSVIVPPVETEAPFVPEPETPPPPPPSPSPTPEPSPSGTTTEQPIPDPSSSEGPSDAPTSEPPLLPLPGGGQGSEDPSPPPSEGSTQPPDEGAGEGDSTVGDATEGTGA